jgi:hypothetical protein
VLDFTMIRGRMECVRVDLRSCREPGEVWPPGLPSWDENPEPVTLRLWRKVPVTEMIRDVRQHLLEVDAEHTQSMINKQQDPALRRALSYQLMEARQQLAGPNALPASAYEEVATVYRDAWLQGRHPTKAVAEHFHITPSAAAKRVSRARQNGLLPPTEFGVAGLGREEGKT